MAKTKTEIMTYLAIEAGLPDTIHVTYHRAAKRWYIEYPMALGPDAALRHRRTLVASYGSLEEARETIARDVATFNTTYARILAVLGGAVDRLTIKEAQLLLDAQRLGRSASPVDAAYRQLEDEGVVQTMPQLGSRDVAYTLTPLGERVVTTHHDALIARASSDDTPDAAEHITKRYDSVTPTKQRNALHTLLDQLADTDHVDPALLEQARTELAQLEQYAAEGAAGDGDDAPRQDAPIDIVPIAWNQPSHRQTPLYAHTIVCEVCGERVTVQTHASTPPRICDDEACRTTHTRILARERKRRQRERERQARADES